MDQPPESPELTAYDRDHLKLYVRLLDAEADGACWEEVVEILFGLDPETEPQRAILVYNSHLARAKWMSENGFRHWIRSKYN